MAEYSIMLCQFGQFCRRIFNNPRSTLNLLASVEASYTKGQKIAIGAIAFYLLSAIVFNLIFLLETVPIDISGQTEDSKKLAAQGVSYQSISEFYFCRLLL